MPSLPYRDKLAYSRKPRAIGLHKMHAAIKKKVLKHYAVGHMLSRGDAIRCDGACQLAMRVNIVWMRRLFDPVWVKGGQRLAHAQRIWRIPSLVGVEHQNPLVAGDFTQHGRTPHIAFFITGTNLQL